VHRTAAASSSASPPSIASPPGASSLPAVPQELVQYVENGRNPDIYTREFVELVRRGNQLMRGKMRAFAGFRDVLAGEMSAAMPELRDDVARVVAATGVPLAESVPVDASVGVGGGGDGSVKPEGP
jgi:mediator of RNA polymerase II transcription subunit 10